MKKGFTLIEMLMTLSVFVILAGISAPFYMSFQARNDLGVTTSVVVSSLRRAQSMSQNMELDSAWGLKIAAGKITLFKGANFASRDSQYDEEFSISPAVSFSGINEVVFVKMSGETENVGDIIISANNNEKTITVNKKGMLEF